MLNNKGQSLVLFVVVLPILMLIMMLVIDIGKMIVLKQELNNISEIVLVYGLDNLDKEELVSELKELTKMNKSDIDEINISIEEEKILIELNDKCDGIFSGFIDIGIFDVSTSYVGYMENEFKRIERLGD